MQVLDFEMGAGRKRGTRQRVPQIARPDSGNSGRGGFSLVELSVAVGVLATGLLGLTSVVLSSQKLTISSTEAALTRTALEAQLEGLRARLHEADRPDFAAVVARDNWGTPGTAGEPTGTPLPLTLVEGREPFQLHVRVYRDEAQAQADLGLLNLDLDGDGVAGESGALAASALRAAPVRLRLSYRPATWKAGDPTVKVEYVGLLY